MFNWLSHLIISIGLVFSGFFHQTPKVVIKSTIPTTTQNVVSLPKPQTQTKLNKLESANLPTDQEQSQNDQLNFHQTEISSINNRVDTIDNKVNSITQNPVLTDPVAIANPSISFFTSNVLSLEVGKTAILSWSVNNATSVSIDNGIGSVPVDGTFNVSPVSNTTYILTATNSIGSIITAQITINVIQPPPPTPITPIVKLQCNDGYNQNGTIFGGKVVCINLGNVDITIKQIIFSFYYYNDSPNAHYRINSNGLPIDANGTIDINGNGIAVDSNNPLLLFEIDKYIQAGNFQGDLIDSVTNYSQDYIATLSTPITIHANSQQGIFYTKAVFNKSGYVTTKAIVDINGTEQTLNTNY